MKNGTFPATAGQLTLWSEEPLAKILVSLGNERGYMESVLAFSGNISEFLRDSSLNGLFGKMYPECFQADLEPTTEQLSTRLHSVVMAVSGEYWTFNMCEWTGMYERFHSEEDVCSLLDILETGDLPQRFYLSPRACAGILRRAAKRGKELPEHLQEALQSVAATENYPQVINI